MENKDLTALDQGRQLAIKARFQTAAEVLAEWGVKAFGITVIDEADTQGMALAREARLMLRKHRTAVETTRKELKEASLKEGRAIDSVAKDLREKLEAMEAHLEKQEKYAEIKEAERIKTLNDDRLTVLDATGLLPFYSAQQYGSLGAMTPEMFRVTRGVLSEKKQRAEQEDAERQAAARAEQERQAAERAELETLRREKAEEERRQAEARAKAVAELDEKNRFTPAQVVTKYLADMLDMVEDRPVYESASSLEKILIDFEKDARHLIATYSAKVAVL